MNRWIKSKKKKEIWSKLILCLSLVLINPIHIKAEVANLSGGMSYIGTFEGDTTFATSSDSGVSPGLFIEVMDRYGNLTQYESGEGVIAISGTKEGSYVTQAKLLGKTKYKDLDTNEWLDEWEEGRNLKLVSVENPKLLTVGKNLFDGTFEQGYLIDATGLLSEQFKQNGISSQTFMPVSGDTTYYFGIDSNPSLASVSFYFYDENQNYLSYQSTNSVESVSFQTPKEAKYMKFRLFNQENGVSVEDYRNVRIQIEMGSEGTDYVKHQSNRLTMTQDIKILGIGTVRDDVNLLTGEMKQRLVEVLIDGNEEWGVNNGNNEGFYSCSTTTYVGKPKGVVISDKVASISTTTSEGVMMGMTTGKVLVSFGREETGVTSLRLFKERLSQLQLKVQYERLTELSNMIGLNSTYEFRPVTTRDVYITGNALPLVCSVNVPTVSLNFVLNPNEKGDKQFIAPNFSIINETPVSIRVSLKAFEQVTDVFNDVLPTEHNDWYLLDKEQSKDLALALVPIASEGWLTVDDRPHYVADFSTKLIGEIKGESSAEFTFEASHGRAFLEGMEAIYKMVFVFDF